MVSSKNKKATKYTYAERVLGSFSLIQREHRKHAIHLASLRAQVQKIANSRRDKLGPHWKNWVNKAVHRLEEDGILAPSEPAGTLVLTPNGKKAISAARRSLALSPDQEDLLWKQVTHQASDQAVKRARPRDLSSDDEEDFDDDEPEYVPPKSRKRARKSLYPGQAADPAFKLTKAELVAELTNLRRAREADLLRAASPLTELEDDESEELMRLKEILKQKEEEMHDLRLELADRNGEDPPDILMSPPNRNIVIRTQSGSHIDHLSKQPTPAPTEPDSNEYDDCDVFDGPEPVPAVRSSFAVSLVTPEATPARNQSQAQVNTVSSLEHALRLRATELQNLEHNLSEIKTQLAQNQISLSDKDTRISILQTNVNSYESQISEKDVGIASQSSRVSHLERAKVDLEMSIAEKVAQLERLVCERDNAIASLQSNHQLELSRLRQELSDSEQAIAARVAEIQTVKTQETSLESSIADLRHELDSQIASNVILAEERARLAAELSEQKALVGASDEAKQALLKKIAELDRCIREQGAVQLSLKEEIARAATDLAAESERLRGAETTNESLVARLVDATTNLTTAQNSLVEARASAEALKPQMAALDDALTQRISSQREVQEQLVKTQRELDTFRLKVNILETTVSNVRADLESKKLEICELETNLAVRVEENTALTSSLYEQQQKLTDVNGAKEGLQTRLDEVISQLQLARDAGGKLQQSRDMLLDQLAAADAAKTSLIAELATTSATVKETAVKLGEAEATEAKLRAEVAANDQEIRQLRGDVEDLALELGSTRKSRDEFQARLEGDVRRVTDALDAEKLRGQLLEAERTDAIMRVQEVEDELLELQVSKEADAATIEGLKDVFSQLKTAQMQSLAELDNKLGSAHSSPVPKRRASKVPARSA
ncbi:hypothetical protein DFH07DRAFT_852129 [Mycena maculata]|uniref:Uncharacterized protein n=1 Tax=Mycena maculata TaxID=230809 RepID=A0AAD7MR28_9AGAR|nr:hypothetical protein DFH07DRAFT_852278 [Mycena maculata]KAJ7727142.1 hypothetical protein DFH07DRAFT_852129 [Mycena maculata]